MYMRQAIVNVPIIFENHFKNYNICYIIIYVYTDKKKRRIIMKEHKAFYIVSIVFVVLSVLVNLIFGICCLSSLVGAENGLSVFALAITLLPIWIIVGGGLNLTSLILSCVMLKYNRVLGFVFIAIIVLTFVFALLSFIIPVNYINANA